MPGSKPVFYQKHMTHHMAPSIPRGWMGEVTNAFLIRDPARVLASYARKMEEVSLEAIGVPQQAELFDRVCQLEGTPPPVVDSDDILADPPGMLRALCDALKIPYTDKMLSWSAGAKPEDGVWAPHWYDAVWQSTGFGAPREAPPALPDDFSPDAPTTDSPGFRRLIHNVPESKISQAMSKLQAKEEAAALSA